MEIKRLLINICSNELEQSKNFYTSLFDLKIEYNSDWFIHLVSADKVLEIGILSESHEIVPAQAKGKITGSYLTFVVETVDVLFQEAQSLGYPILQEPDMTFYGQKRMLLKAPEGTICDVSSPA